MRQPAHCLLAGVAVLICQMIAIMADPETAALTPRHLRHAVGGSSSSPIARSKEASASSTSGFSDKQDGRNDARTADTGKQLMDQLLQSAVTSDAAQGSSIGNSLLGDAGASTLQQAGPTGDCAEPLRVNLDRLSAESADIVITGVVMAAGEGNMVCAPDSNTSLPLAANNLTKDSLAGPNLVVEYEAAANSSASAVDGSITLLVAVQCVHKGALACRRSDNKLSRNGSAGAGSCMVAVIIPAQKMPSKRDNTTLPPCSVTPGFRYMMMLSSKAAASCDGAYSTAHSRIIDSIRPHLGVNFCAPYPSWPSQDTSTGGDGLANLLTQQCPGAAPRKAVKCRADICTQAQCPKATGITCVIKSCEGRYMVGNTVTPQDSCMPLFLSHTTGLPVDGCDATVRQLNRQARQSQRRLGTAGSTANLLGSGVVQLGS